MSPKKQAKKAKALPKRKQPVKPKATNEPPLLVNARFFNNQARDRFREIKGYRVIQERGFNVPKLVGNPEFSQAIMARGWESLNNMIFEQGNKTVAAEFYANARFTRKKYVSYVRGKEIDYILEVINTLLDIHPPEECDVQRKKDECKHWSEEQWDELILKLCVEGAKWQGGARTLLMSEFKSVPKAWESFVVQTLERTSFSFEIPLCEST